MKWRLFNSAVSFSPVDSLIHNASKSLHFPPFWATMHISSSQWNIKHSYDLIFSSKGGFQIIYFLHIICFSSESKLPGMSLFGVFVYWRDVWLVNAGVMINQATNRFERLSRLRGHWSIRGLSTERQVGLIPARLIETREAQTVRLSVLPPDPWLKNVNCYLGEGDKTEGAGKQVWEGGIKSEIYKQSLELPQA